MSDDHGRLIKVTHTWERIVAEKDEEIAKLRAELDATRKENDRLEGLLDAQQTYHDAVVAAWKSGDAAAASGIGEET